MEGLPALIRLHTWELDAKRRELADIEREEDEIHGRVAQLEAQVAREQAFARESESGMFVFAGFMRGVKEIRRKFEQQIAEVRQRIEAKREEVAQAFQELKRYEIALAEREKREKIEADRIAQAALDEISLNQHRRREGA